MNAASQPRRRTLFAGNFHVLLAILLLTMFLEPFAEESVLIYYVSRSVVLLSVLAALQVIARSPATRTTGRGIFVLLLVLELAHWIFGPNLRGLGDMALAQLARLVQLAAFAWILFLLAVSLLHMKRVSAQAVSASLCGYLLIGLWFFVLYSTLPVDSFHPLPAKLANGELPERRDDLFYYSYVTLTSLGYGDVTPAHPITRALAVVEVVIGQFYLAVLIARQVGLYLVGRSGDDTREEAQ